MRQRWSRDRIIEEIRRIAVDGEASSYGRKQIARAAAHYFGSWTAACEAAGVRPRQAAVQIAAPPEVQRRRMAFLRQHPHLRERLWLYVLAVKRGYIRAGGDGGMNPFASLNGGPRPLRGAARPAS